MFNRFRLPVAWLSSALWLSLFLAACSGAAQPAPTQTAPAASTSEPAAQQPAATAEATTIAATTEAAAAPAENATAAKPAQAICQAVEIPNNDLLAPVSDQDWSKGLATASVTLIEFGDFQ